MSRPVNVSFIPDGGGFLRNALFERRREGGHAHSPNAHWMDCYAVLREKARQRNILMNTADVAPAEQADIVAYMMIPSPQEILAFKRKNPRIKTLLILWETSLGGAVFLNPRNHAGFDVVLTYKPSLVDRKKYFPMRPHAYDRSRIRSGRPFNERRIGCLVGTNRKFRYRSGVMARARGWRFSAADWIDYVFCPGELIRYRSQVGRLCAQYGPGTFDIYGDGWDIHPETRDVCLGIPKTSTLEYMGGYRYYFAFENHRGKQSLISERIWDALWGDAVPVYCGNPEIAKYIPKGCFVDAADFDMPSQMLDWLARSSEVEWTRYRDAGRAFIHSHAIEQFLPDACAEELLEPFLMLAKT
jgi:Glycosyltransferase family 10 (fucosyltransferase) C-term